MNRVALRSLPGVADVEAKLLREDSLMADELADLEAEIDRVSLALFGLTAQDTAWPPEGSDAAAKAAWDKHFDFLAWEYEEEGAFWEAYGVDVTDEAGEPLDCLGVFGRQLVCALKGLHPAAGLAFLGGAKSESQIQAEAEAWGRALRKK